MSPSSLCRRGEEGGRVEAPLHRHMCTRILRKYIHTQYDCLQSITTPSTLSACGTISSPNTPPLSLSTAPSPQQGQTPACPLGLVSSPSSLPASAARLSVSTSPRTAPSEHGFSPQPTHTDKHLWQMNIQMHTHVCVHTRRNRKSHDLLWMWGYNKYFNSFDSSANVLSV